MGEIKSTLDLVMERTRNMTLSDEERREQAAESFRRALDGLMRRYSEGSLKLSETRREVADLKASNPEATDEAIREGLLARVSVEGPADGVLTLLRDVTGLDPAPLVDLRSACEAELREAMTRRMAERKEELARVHGISGSAVVPNPRTDPTWSEQRRKITADYSAELDRVRAQM
jgi:hypothetical protein